MADYSKIARAGLSALKGVEDAAPAVNRLDMSFKDVTKRIPELTEAANMVARGEMTAAQYDALVRRLKPVVPYDFVPQPATAEDAMRALTENKRPMFGKTAEMSAGEQADLRLDIPAYKDYGVWVNSIHRKDQPTVYGSTSSVKNATMIGAPEKALKVAQGGPKAPFAVIRGEWNPMDEAKAVKNAQKYLNHPDWKQVGYDPERHGFFYDRATMQPIVGADEVIQIGPLVLAKKPKYGKPEDFPFKRGGGVHMQAGGLSALATMLRGGKKLSKAEEASLRARGLGVPGVEFADPMNPKDIMRMSEALGAAGAEGKTLNITQADRSRVFGPNKGGTGFSGLQLTSEPHQQAGSVWGVGKPTHVTRLINANDPNTIWSTFIGSPTQHMSNPVTVQRMYEAHKAANPSAELIEKMNRQLNSAINPKTKKPIFPDGIDISDPSALDKAKTFDQRKAIAQAMTIGGEKKGEKAAQEAFKIIKEETDPLLVESPTYAVGNRLFTIDKETGIHRPDLNAAFPHQVTGTDLGLLFEPTPIELAMPMFTSKFEGRLNKSGKPQPMGHKDLSATTPRQFISEEYLTQLQKAGYKEGGNVNQQSFTSRLKSGIEQHMAVGGGVTNTSDTRPDVTDSGNMIPAPFYAKGGEINLNFKGLRGRQPKRFDDGGIVYQDPLGAPTGGFDETTRKAIANVAGKGKEQLEREFKMLRDPKARADILKRMGLQAAGGAPDLLNLLASGVDLVQQQIPGLRKPASVLDPSGKTLGFQPKVPLSSDEPTLGSAHLIRKAQEAGVVGENEAPIIETVGGILGGVGAAKAAPAVGRAARRGARAFEANVLNEAIPNIRRDFTPATLTVESTAPDLGQGTTYGYRQGLNDRLLGGMSSFYQQPNKVREAVGTSRNLAGELEINPMLAVDVPFAGSIGKDAPIVNKEFRRQAAQAGVDLNQEAMAAHRFIPLTTNNINDASAMLIKTKEGLDKDQIQTLAKILGSDMVVSHNPRLGGVVVYPFSEVKRGEIPKEFLDAQTAAHQVLGKKAKIQYGKTDPKKDQLYITNEDYASEGAVPMSANQARVRRELQGQQKFLFPESTAGIPGEVKASPIGGLQPWSRGPAYPTHVIGVGDDWQPVNFLTGESGKRHPTFRSADEERQQMLERWHRTLPSKVR